MKIVMGTMTIGNQADAATGSTMLDRFVDAGYTEFDTAYVYNAGKTETILGELLSQKSWADDITIAGKANPKEPGGLSADGIDMQLSTSLERLQRPNVDLFYLHQPDLDTPIDDTLAAIDKAYREGKVGAFGLSNYAAWQVAQIFERCDKNGWPTPVCYQGMYNAITRDVERELFKCLADYNMAFYAYNPLAGGLLTGKYEDTDSLPDSGRFSYHKGYPERYWKDDNHRAVAMIRRACKKLDIPVVNAALGWMLHHSPLATGHADHAVILGASSVEQLDQNLAACQQGALPQELIDVIDDTWEMCRPSCIKYFRP